MKEIKYNKWNIQICKVTNAGTNLFPISNSKHQKKVKLAWLDFFLFNAACKASVKIISSHISTFSTLFLLEWIFHKEVSKLNLQNLSFFFIFLQAYKVSKVISHKLRTQSRNYIRKGKKSKYQPYLVRFS